MAHGGQWCRKDRPLYPRRPSKSPEVCDTDTCSWLRWLKLLAAHSLLAQSSSPSYTLKQSVRLPYSQPRNPSPIPVQALPPPPLPILPSSKLAKCTFNVQGRSSAPQHPLFAWPPRNVLTFSSEKSTPLARCSGVLSKYQPSNFWRLVLARLTTKTKRLVPILPSTRDQISCGGNIPSPFRASSARFWRCFHRGRCFSKAIAGLLANTPKPNLLPKHLLFWNQSTKAPGFNRASGSY